MKPTTTTPLKVPVTITIPDMERLVLLAELFSKKPWKGDGYVWDSNMSKQITSALFQNGIKDWTTWEPPQPLKVGDHEVVFKDNDVQVGCTFVDKETIMEIVRRMTV